MASCIIDGFKCGYNIAFVKMTKSHCIALSLNYKSNFMPTLKYFLTITEKIIFLKN